MKYQPTTETKLKAIESQLLAFKTAQPYSNGQAAMRYTTVQGAHMVFNPSASARIIQVQALATTQKSMIYNAWVTIGIGSYENVTDAHDVWVTSSFRSTTAADTASVVFNFYIGVTGSQDVYPTAHMISSDDVQLWVGPGQVT